MFLPLKERTACVVSAHALQAQWQDAASCGQPLKTQKHPCVCVLWWATVRSTEVRNNEMLLFDCAAHFHRLVRNLPEEKAGLFFHLHVYTVLGEFLFCPGRVPLLSAAEDNEWEIASSRRRFSRCSDLLTPLTFIWAHLIGPQISLSGIWGKKIKIGTIRPSLLHSVYVCPPL